MNVFVTEADGLSSKTYLSIRVGDTRRQAPLREGQPFQFPTWNHKSLSVDVFEKVGSQVVGLEGLQDGSFIATKESFQNVQIETASGSQIKLALKLGLTDQAARMPDQSRAQRHETALEAKQYLDTFCVQNLLQTMIHNLLDQKPEDPITFMCTYLSSHRDEVSRLCAEKRGVTPSPAAAAAASAAAASAAAGGASAASSPSKVAHQAQSVSGSKAAQPASKPHRAKSSPRQEQHPVAAYAASGSGSAPSASLSDLSNHHSLMAEVLRAKPSLYESMRELRTVNGVSLSTCINTGVENRGHPMCRTVGAVAGDEECYDVFREFFDSVIDLQHDGYSPEAIHPTDLDHMKVASDEVDPLGKYVVGARVETRRSLRGYRLPPSITREQRREVEQLVSKALLDLPDELGGEYIPLASAQGDKQRLFQRPDSNVLLSSGIADDWPDARGIFVSANKRTTAWINGEDHLRMVSTSGDLKSAFAALSETHSAVAGSLEQAGQGFAHNDHLGYVTAYPQHLGAAMRVSVTVHLPLASASEDLPAVCKPMKLRARAVGEDWEISNEQCLGISEVDLVNQLIDGCKHLVDLETSLQTQQ